MTSISNSSDFYVLGGTLPRDARSYAVRKADQDLLEGLRNGQFCYVLTSRQMGKSSLMVRTVTRLRQESVTCLVIDLTATGQNLSEDQWYDGLLNCVATDLSLEDELDDFWQANKRLGPLQRWMHALRSVVLTHITGPVVIFVDEVDAVRSLPFSADEFFAGVRECYNRRTEDPEFNRLTFCLLGVATPADLIRDTRSTPFNIGKRIALTDFTEEEAAPLAEGLAPHKEGERGRGGDEERQRLDEGETRGGREGEKMLLSRVLYWTHGHPYLTQRLCSAVSESLSVLTPNTQHLTPGLVDRICNDIFLSPGAQATDDNLLFVRERLLRADCDPTSLLMLYDKVRSGKRVPNSETDYQIGVLRLSGIVRVENGVLCVRNRIYAHVFDRAWVRRSIPDEDVKRQKSAFRRGVLGTAAAIASLLLLAIGGFMLTHFQKHLNMRLPLPDGAQLIVHDVTFGKAAVYEPSMFRWGALFGRRSSTIVFREPTFSVWVSKYNPRTGISDVPSFNPQIIAVDEHGDQFVPYSVAVMADPKAMRFDFTNFPRRSKTIHLQYYAANSLAGVGSLVKEFNVHNPAPMLYPLWTPEPLPATKTVDNLTVGLNSVRWLQNGVIGIPNTKLQMQNHQFWPDYSCRVRGMTRKKPDSNWTIEEMELSDATGNSSNAQSTAGSLCIFEPAWRLHMGLVKSAGASFTDAETWTLKGVNMPKDGSIVQLAGSGKIGGVTLEPISLATAPSVAYPDGSPPAPSGTLGKRWGDHSPVTYGGKTTASIGTMEVNGFEPQIAVRAAGLADDQKLTVWATDAGGRRYNQLSEALIYLSITGAELPVQVRLLLIPPNVRKVDLHFSVHDIKTVEFMVRPPLPGAGNNSK